MSDSDNDVIDTAAAVSDVVAAHAATQGVVMGEAAFGTTAATQRTDHCVRVATAFRNRCACVA